MGKFRVEIDLDTTVTFESNKIKQLSTRTMATNDPTKPVFDVFANQGLLVIKDTDLSIYNKAINGTFDNIYQFNVRFYKGDTLIASHIINQRPVYDYANKTLTLNLGNELDNINNILYKGYEYPLKQKNLSLVTSDILSSYIRKGISEYEDNTSPYRLLDVPYLPEISTKQALKKVCEAQGSSLILSEDRADNILRFKFIDMLGRSGNNKKIYKILPKHTKSSFKPNIILDNRFSNAIVNATSLYKQTENNSPVFEEKFNISSQELENSTWEEYNNIEFKAGYGIPNYSQIFKISNLENIALGIYNYGGYYYRVIKSIPLYQKSNLKKVITVPSPQKETDTYYENSSSNETKEATDYANVNPIITLNLKKITYNSFTIENNAYANISTGKIEWNFYNNFDYGEARKKGIQEEKFLSQSALTQLENENVSYNGQSETFTFLTYRNLVNPNIKFNENTNEYNVSARVLIGKSYLKCFCSYNPTTSLLSPTYQLVEIVPYSMQINYNGIVEEIKFDQNLQIISTDNNVNKIETEKGNELIQTYLDGKPDGSSAKELQKDLYKFYKNGIRTGDIEVIFDNYVAEDGVTQKDIDTPFKVGDFVVPCKDNQGTHIIDNVGIFTKTQTAFSRGENKVNTVTISIDKKFIFIEKISGWSNNGTVSIKSYKINENGNGVIVDFSTLTATEVVIKVQVGVPKPCVYKVVDVEIDYNGGAGSQRLKLMEQPNLTLENTATASEVNEASEPMATMLLDEETPLETQIDESQGVLSNNNETSQEMSNNGFDDLINL